MEDPRLDIYGRVGKLDLKNTEQDKRLDQLEYNEERHEDRMKLLEDHGLRLENTVLTESRDTRRTMTEQTDKMLEIIGSSLGYRSVSEINNHKLKMAKWSTMSGVFLKITGGLLALLSTGGIGYAVVMYFLGGE